MPECLFTYYDSPVGKLYLEQCEGKLTHLLFADKEGRNKEEQQSHENEGFRENEGIHENGTRSEAPFKEVIQQLEAYFSGTLKKFDLPLKPDGTDFQRIAWKALQKIPYGETRTYAQQAKVMDNPKACRAVGAANGQNPISIIIPCHRVVGSNGKLTGYGGGLKTKEFLLELEARNK